VTTTTTLAELRVMIDKELNVADVAYQFLDSRRRTFPTREEDKRQVLADLGREVLLIPSNFITLQADDDDDDGDDTRS
jgi:hypothetical protein